VIALQESPLSLPSSYFEVVWPSSSCSCRLYLLDVSMYLWICVSMCLCVLMCMCVYVSIVHRLTERISFALCL
jgi:hypothetical protein